VYRAVSASYIVGMLIDRPDGLPDTRRGD
jgi:hypothetical protein